MLVILLFQLIIKPYHYAVFTVTIVAPQEEGAYAAEVWMFTHYEVSVALSLSDVRSSSRSVMVSNQCVLSSVLF